MQSRAIDHHAGPAELPPLGLPKREQTKVQAARGDDFDGHW